MIVDFHQHFYPDRLAGRVLRPLAEASGFAPVTDGTYGDTLRKNREWGVDRAVLLPVATSPHCASSNRFSLECAGEAVIPFATIHPDTPQPEAYLEGLKEQGFQGVKLHPQYQHADIDDPRYLRIIRTAAALCLPVIFQHQQ